MLDYVLTFISAGLFMLLIEKLLSRPFHLLSTIAVKQVDVIIDKSMSEEDKDNLLLANLLHLLKALGLTIALLAVVLAIALVPIILYAAAIGVEKFDTSSWKFYAAMILGTSVVFIKRGEQNNYSFWSKLLHELILDNYNIGKRLFARATKNNLVSEEDRLKKFVVVTGLARSGTTALLNLIYDPEYFHATKYSDMPFLLAPRTFTGFVKGGTGQLKERAHKDGILINEDSIEALEEYFFKVFTNDCYIGSQSLSEHDIPQNTYIDYVNFQKLFIGEERKTLYLTKNNNYLLRHNALRSRNTNYIILVMFRDPIQHAISLFRQHKLFLKSQKEDDFVLRYMNWLGHHEFGLNHKQFEFDKKPFDHNYEPDDINYWLEVWINYYEYVLECTSDSGMLLFSHEDLSSTPEKLKEYVYNKLELVPGKEEVGSYVKHPGESNFEIEPNLKARANEAYKALIRNKQLL